VIAGLKAVRLATDVRSTRDSFKREPRPDAASAGASALSNH